MKKILISLVFLLAVSAVSAATADSVQKSITVDGDVGDWQGVSSYQVAEVAPGDSLPSSSDLSGSFRTAWDSEYIYFLAEVTDDEVDSTGADYIFEHDSIEMMLDGGNEKSTSYDENDHKFMARADGQDVMVWDGGWSSPRDSMIASAQQTTDGYILEVGISWNLVGGQSSSDGVTYGFDFAINDRDNEAYSDQLIWKHAEEHSKDTSGWHSLELSGNALSSSTYTISPYNPDFTSSDTQSVVFGVSDTIVYGTGYYSLDGGTDWTSFSLTGESNIGDWVLSDASSSLDLSLADVNESGRELIAFYACSWSGSWDCHGNDWQMAEFEPVLPEPSSSPVCNNGIVETGEECDSTALRGETCQTQGFDNGTLSCSDSCTLDTSGCYNNTENAVCGDGVIEGDEECDGGDLDGASCQSEGYESGSLGCDSDTCKLDRSSCSNPTFKDSREGDEEALEALYSAANGDSWKDNAGWSSSGMDLSDDIHGVTVETIDGEQRVVEIDLRLNGLTGSIDVPEIGNLKELELFAVNFNSLDSYIPEELMGLANSNLRYLYLGLSETNEELRTLHPHEATNTGGGRIHPGKQKYTEQNVFRGTLHAPPDPQNAVLEWLFVSWTDTEELAEDGIDAIEPGIFQIPTMVGLQLYENTGVGGAGNYQEFPDLRAMPNLRIFGVGGGTGTSWDEDRHGYFTGTVGNKVEGMSELIELSLSRHGQLTLDLRETDLSGLTKVIIIGTVGTNMLADGLPAYFFDGTLPNLQNIVMSWPKNSGMTGELPEFTGDINLKVFSITDHDMSGEIPASFWESFPEMINTNFGYNRFTSIGTDDLTNLGSRSSWWQIRNLRWYNNEIRGPWPKLAWGTSQLDKFTRFQVANNRYVFRDMLYVPDNAPNGETVFELMQQEADVSFSYAPQKPFGTAETVNANVGDDLVLDNFVGNVSHVDNVYHWEKDGSSISGATSRTLTLNNVDGGDSGTYKLIVDNPNVPALTLESEPIELVVS